MVKKLLTVLCLTSALTAFATPADTRDAQHAMAEMERAMAQSFSLGCVLGYVSGIKKEAKIEKLTEKEGLFLVEEAKKVCTKTLQDFYDNKLSL